MILYLHELPSEQLKDGVTDNGSKLPFTIVLSANYFILFYFWFLSQSEIKLSSFGLLCNFFVEIIEIFCDINIGTLYYT